MASSTPEKAPLRKTVYTGTFISTPTLGSLKILEDAAVGVDEAGIIRYVETDLELDKDGDGEGYESAVGEVVRGWGWDWGAVEWVRGLGEGEGKGVRGGRGGGGGGKGWFFPGFVGEFILSFVWVSVFRWMFLWKTGWWLVVCSR